MRNHVLILLGGLAAAAVVFFSLGAGSTDDDELNVQGRVEPAPDAPARAESVARSADSPTAASDPELDVAAPPQGSALVAPALSTNSPLINLILDAEVATVEIDPVWMETSFEDRERLFRDDGRDPDWAAAMEQLVAAQISEWNDPPVQLLQVECRSTMCRVAMFWPSNPHPRNMGIQLSSLFGLGLDHQGDMHGVEEANGHLAVLIGRRM